MNEFLPPQSVATLDALLMVLADPGKHREMLDVLGKQTAASQLALASAQAAQSELNTRRTELEAFESQLEGRANALDRRSKELDAQKASLEAARKEHTRAMDDLARTTKSHEKREIELGERARALAEKEQHAAEMHAKAESILQQAMNSRADYERKIARLKELTG